MQRISKKANADHLILKEDIFLKDVQKGLDFVKNNNALVTLGIKPSRPAGRQYPEDIWQKLPELYLRSIQTDLNSRKTHRFHKRAQIKYGKEFN